ncbi:MAG: RluA family pseudouridine synthase [Dehalococcoidia bacterium]|nr:RluA family pseudouridine synthase [Dehalococcoidia bacterium]
MEILHFVCNLKDIRLDKYLSEQCSHLSRSFIQKLIAKNYVTVNDRAAKAHLKLNVNDKLTVTIPPTPTTTLTPENIPLHIIYEDNDVIVVDKPAGLVVYPSPGHPNHTLLNAILARCPNLLKRDSPRPGIVHRLDKDTSGLILVAKNEPAQADLQAQFKSHSVTKQYLVLIQGHITPEQGEIEAPIGRDPLLRKHMTIMPNGKKASTLYQVIKYADNYSLLKITLNTGRTHQIRVHLSAIGYPVTGDKVYGAKASFLDRQFVHAHILKFKLPSSDELVEFKSELPQDLKQALEHISDSK